MQDPISETFPISDGEQTSGIDDLSKDESVETVVEIRKNYIDSAVEPSERVINNFVNSGTK